MKQAIRILILIFCLFVAGCSKHGSNSTPTHEDTLRFEKIKQYNHNNEHQKAMRELETFLATPRQHTSHMDMEAINSLSWLRFAYKHQQEAMQLVLRGDSLAHAANDKQMMAIFRFSNGRYTVVEDEALGCRYMQEGITLMEQCLRDASTPKEQTVCVRRLLNFYPNLLQFMLHQPASKCSAILAEQESLLKQCKINGWLTAEELDAEYFNLWRFRLPFEVENGQRKEAEETFRLMQQSPVAKAGHDEGAIMESLMMLGHFQEAIDLMEKRCQQYRAEDDTLDLNENYHSLIQSLAACYDSLGIKDKAQEYQTESRRLQDAITIHHANQNLGQLSAQFEVQQHQYLLDEEHARFRYALSITLALGLLLILALAGYLYYRRVNRVLNQKNQILAKNINALLDGRFDQEPPLPAADKGQSADTTKQDSPLAQSTPEMDEAAVRQVRWFIHELTERELYRNADFDRDVLLDELHIPHRSFAQQFEACTGSTIAQSVLALRLEYAAELIRSNDNYTIDSIAQESGFSGRSTFYRNFTREFGITPTEYRAQCHIQS